MTLGDGSRWLVHKGDNYGISSQTVVVDARHMGPDWTVSQSKRLLVLSCAEQLLCVSSLQVLESKNFQGRKTVSDLVRAGGPDYYLLFDNCHLASKRVMNQ